MIKESHKLRLKKLAGIICESRDVEGNFEPSLLQVGIGMILKLSPENLNKVFGVNIPTEDLTTNYKMTQLPNDKVHVTLTSIKGFKPFKNDFKDFTLPSSIKMPNVEIGECLFVRRPEDKKVTYVMSLSNQEEFKRFVDSVYKSLGLENPEPDRFYHITLANNEGGNPFKSIGNVTKKDFEK